MRMIHIGSTYHIAALRILRSKVVTIVLTAMRFAYSQLGDDPDGAQWFLAGGIDDGESGYVGGFKISRRSLFPRTSLG